MVKAWMVVGAILQLPSTGMLLTVSLHPTWLLLGYMPILLPVVLDSTGIGAEVL